MDFIENQSEFYTYYKENIKVLQRYLDKVETQKMNDEILAIQFLIEILREQITNENINNSPR